MKTQNEITLKLFNTVVTKESRNAQFLSEYGVFVDSSAALAISDIKKHLKTLKLSGVELNKTFHKSWSVIQKSTREELAIQQILHYFSTYGSNFEAEMYLPDEILNIPDLKINVSVIEGTSKKALIEKCLDLFRSGIALKEDTIDDLFSLLKNFKYKFTGKEGFKNKEANIILAKEYKIFPEAPEEFLRYLVSLATESTSLVKNAETIELIKASNTEISKDINLYGIKKIAPIFNRFKVLFLAFKAASKTNTSIINKLSKLSKTMHTPMPQNSLNLVTQNKLTSNDVHWLDNATIYALFKALSACYSRKEGQTSFVYRIRNGKSWVKSTNVDFQLCSDNYDFLLNYLKTRVKGENKNVLVPENIVYGLPTSEKMFVGNIPTGTKFLGDQLAAGIYWENSWGATDLDLSGMNISGKIGWNADYYSGQNDLSYSGDLTNAEEGAVELLRSGSNNNIEPTLVMNNVYSGEADCSYKIIVGQGSDIGQDLMINPNKIMAEIKTEGVQKSMVLGLFLQEDDKTKSFTLLNFGAGNAHVCGESDVSIMATKALYEQWKKPLNLNIILKELGFNIIFKETEDINVDFNLGFDIINKSTFIDLFK
jgi:hypothetical protein